MAPLRQAYQVDVFVVFSKFLNKSIELGARSLAVTYIMPTDPKEI